jgi:hypothetical protein
VDDEWQQIPDEWLQTPETKAVPTKKAAAKKAKPKPNDGDESDLSELTDEEEHQAELKATQAAQVTPDAREDSPLSEAPEPSPPPEIPDDDADEDYNPEADEAEGVDDEKAESERGDDSISPKTEAEDEEPAETNVEEEKDFTKGNSAEPAVGSKAAGEATNGTVEMDVDNADTAAAAEAKPADVDESKMEVDPAEDDETKQGGPADNAEDEDGEVVKEEDPADTDEVKLAVKEAAEVPDGFIEWEAVSTTRGWLQGLTSRSAFRSTIGRLGPSSSPSLATPMRRLSTSSF